MKKIAIYHNLQTGGGLYQVRKYCEQFRKKGYTVDIFTNTNSNAEQKDTKYFEVPESKNSIDQIFRILPLLNKKQREIANIINNNNYSIILVFPCHVTQAPFINKYIKGNNFYYMFLETKREFYENTSFDYLSAKRIVARIIRFPIKIIDRFNCVSAKKIITNSYYSQYVLKKIYNKKSIVIYPNIKYIDGHKSKIKNNKKFLSIGLISKLKNNIFSIYILNKISSKLTLLGNFPKDKINKKFYEKQCNLVINPNEKDKINYYKNNTFYMSNQIMEPFGLTTAEATHYNNFVFGLNEGGTSEIIQNGINGILYPNDKQIAHKIINFYNKKKEIPIQKICKIDWEYSVNNILTITNI